MFVVSRLTRVEYSAVLTALLQMYQKLFSIDLRIDAALGDAEDAQYNALQSTPQFQDAKFLMCFSHVLYNVRKRTRQLGDFAGAMVYKGIIAMHYAANVLECYEIRNTILAQWRKIPLLRSFADYFEKQWINSRFWRWQAFHTSTGFATTNNPCETFNASVKRHVMRKMFDTKRLLRKITNVCEDVTADNVKPTESCGDPPSTLVTTTRKLVHARQLVLFETSNPQVVRILQLSACNGESRRLREAANQAFARLITSKTTGQLYEHLGRRQRRKASAMHNHAMKWSLNMAHRMKMPEVGWTVDLVMGTCECRYFLKMGYCCHLPGARMLSGDSTYSGSRCCERLKDRRVRMKRRAEANAVGIAPVQPPALWMPSQFSSSADDISSGHYHTLHASAAQPAPFVFGNQEICVNDAQVLQELLLQPTPSVVVSTASPSMKQPQVPLWETGRQRKLVTAPHYSVNRGEAHVWQPNRTGRPPLARSALEIQYLLN